MADLSQSVTRDIESDITLPRPATVGHVEVRRIRMLADTPAGAHTHNGPVFGTIMHGRVLFQVDGEPQSTLQAGDVFYEPAEARILHFDALEEDVEFIGVFPLKPEQDAAMEPA